MGYIDRRYFGNGRLVLSSSEDSKEVDVTIDGETTTITVAGREDIAIPPRTMVTVESDGNKAEIPFGYGNCICLNLNNFEII